MRALCEELLIKRREASEHLRVRAINANMFEVFSADSNDVVDLNARSCTCKVFDLDEIPCQHAMAVCRTVKLRSVAPFCSPFYTSEIVLLAYASQVVPLSLSREWVIPAEIRSNIVLPPRMRIP